MSTPRDTPNPGTSTRPDRSSRKVARRKPLAWLPLALLAALALLLALVLLVVNAVDDDGPDGPAGDGLGQSDRSDGAGLNGRDGDGSVVGAPSAQPSAGQSPAGQPQAGQSPAGAPASGGLAGLAAGALVGGGGVPAATDDAAGRSLTGARQAGTAGTVLFAESSAAIDDAGREVIAQAAKGLRTAKARSVQVVGYTDEVAGQAVNDPLSQQRADAVATALRSALQGVTVTTSAKGSADPVASNDDEQGRQQNRRAAIVAQG